VRCAEQIIDSSGLADVFEARVQANQQRPGRPRELSMRTFLIGLFLVTQSGTMHLGRIAPTLNGLPTATRRRLGIHRTGGITDRQVQRLFAAITAALRIGGLNALDEVFDLLCDATQPDEASGTTSIAIDATDIQSWGNRRTIRSKKKVTDPDAKWRGTQHAKAIWKNPLFGYDLTVAVTIPEVNGAAVPLTARRARLRPAASDVGPTGLDIVAATAAMQGTLGDVIADRAYSKRKDGTDFALPVRALGGEPVFALMGYQLGVSDTIYGALIIDGNPFSPATPKNLRSIIPPPVGSSIRDIIAYQQQIAIRAKFAMVPHGRPNQNGDQDYRCPSAAGKLRCGLVPASLALPPTTPTALTPPNTARVGTVCAQATKRFAAIEAPLAQRHLHGSHEWYASWNRRNRVEGFFGNIKDEARESLRRGIIRVRTKEKVGLWLAFAVASANLRLTEAFRRKKNTVQPSPTRGRPRKRGLSSYLPVGTDRHFATANAPPGMAR